MNYKLFLRYMAVVFALFCALFLHACQQPEQAREPSTCMSNILMGGDQFAYRDGFVYFADLRSLYEFDIETGVTVSLSAASSSDIFPYRSLFVTDDRVYYACNGLHYVTRDGKEQGTVFESPENPHMFLYSDENDLYYRKTLRDEEGIPYESLFHRNLETGTETELMPHMYYNCYYVDDEYIYVTTEEQHDQFDNHKLMRSRRDNIQFEEIPISCSPFYAISGEDGLYLTAFQKNLMHYQDGVEKELPFLTSTFQVVGNCILYKGKADSQTCSKSCAPLMCYDLQTGQTTTIYHSVYRFAVLNAGRYLCYWRADYSHQQWYLYDMTTGETTLMYEIPDSSQTLGYVIS